MQLLVLSAIVVFVASLCADAFKIIAPQPGEVINVDVYYNLTWTTEGVGENFLVNTIQVNFPDYALLTDENYYERGFGDDTFNISATQGLYPLVLSEWWSPIYEELPQTSWTIFIQVADNWNVSTELNDTVPVTLTSLSRKQNQRPLLAPIKNLTYNPDPTGDISAESSSSVWQIVLGIIVPLLVVTIIGYLVRFRWKHHRYASLSHVGNLKPSKITLQSSSLGASRQKDDMLPQTLKFSKGYRLPPTFLLAAFLALGPLIALLVALVSLLLQYKVEPVDHWQPDFHINQTNLDPAAFYINYDATRYTTVASWTSSIALLLPGFLTALIWYRLSRELERNTSNTEHDNLLTPYQLSLLLSLKSGTLGSLWEYLLYVCSRRREKQAKFLFNAGFVVLMSTLLGLGIWVADTWLHVVTSTVSFSFASDSLLASSETYGRALFQNCTSDYLTAVGQDWSCVLVSAGLANLSALSDPFAYATIISGRDDTTAIKLVTLGRDRIAYIAPAQVRQNLDYRANTIAVRSVCDSIFAWCPVLKQNQTFVDIGSAQCGKFVGTNFNESDPIAQATRVTNGVVSAVTSFFKDQKWQNLMTIGNASNSFFTVSRLDSAIPPTDWGLPVIFSATDAGILYKTLIGCNTELVNFTYAYINGSIKAADITPLENLDSINAIFEPALDGWNPFISSGAAMTMTATSYDSALNSWIDTLHTDYLSYLAIVTEPTKNIAQQTRSTILVARIPKSPLFTLGMLLVISISFNTFILVISLWNIRLRKFHGMQMIVTVPGLSASKFDNAITDTQSAVTSEWRLFEESKGEKPSTRIGITHNGGGGYSLTAFVSQPTEGRELSHPAVAAFSMETLGPGTSSSYIEAVEEVAHNNEMGPLAIQEEPLLTRPRTSNDVEARRISNEMDPLAVQEEPLLTSSGASNDVETRRFNNEMDPLAVEEEPLLTMSSTSNDAEARRLNTE